MRAGLNFGGAIHEALAYRYRTCPDMPTLENENQIDTLLTKWFQEKPNPPEDHRHSELASEVMKMYNSLHSVEDFSVLVHQSRPAVEVPFAFPLFTYTRPDGTPLKVIWCGRIDLLVRMGGMVYVLDHKTAFMLGDGFFKQEGVSDQHRGYMWAYYQACGVYPTGYIINAIRVPRPTKKGNSLSEDCFQRETYQPDPAEIEEWEHNMKFIIARYLDLCYVHKFFPANKLACVQKYGPCQFFDVCSLAPEHRLALLGSGMYQDADWSPLNLGSPAPSPC